MRHGSTLTERREPLDLDIVEAVIPDPIPGQMYAWEFTVGDGSWPIEYVTEERRHSYAVGRYGMLKRGDAFTVVSTDDAGPYDLDNMGWLRGSQLIDDFDVPAVDISFPPKRWHVALHGGTLFWLEHSLLLCSRLLEKSDGAR